MNGCEPSGARVGERAHLDPLSVTASVPEVVIAQMKGDFKSLLKEIPSSPRLWSFKGEQAGPTRSTSPTIIFGWQFLVLIPAALGDFRGIV